MGNDILHVYGMLYRLQTSIKKANASFTYKNLPCTFLCIGGFFCHIYFRTQHLSCVYHMLHSHSYHTSFSLGFPIKRRPTNSFIPLSMHYSFSDAEISFLISSKETEIKNQCAFSTSSARNDMPSRSHFISRKVSAVA